ncbi:hypothetical protein [Streptomyces sp. NPDC059850]|uniref:hypothetical protein n=1 Tax=Streptomyces sp. NPDC059850 TaxID=3346970 RepID=UPI003657817B
MNEPQLYRPGGPVPDRPAPDPYGLVQQPLSGSVELAAERGPVVHVPGAYGGFVAVRREDLPTIHAPVPVRSGVDPHAQRLAAKGLLSAGTGVGAYFAAGAVAIVVDSLVKALVAGAVAAGVALFPGRRGGGDTYITHHHVSNRWWGKSSTTIRNR